MRMQRITNPKRLSAPKVRRKRMKKKVMKATSMMTCHGNIGGIDTSDFPPGSFIVVDNKSPGGLKAVPARDDSYIDWRKGLKTPAGPPTKCYPVKNTAMIEKVRP